MISQKANKKLYSLLTREIRAKKIETKVEGLLAMITAPNVLIEDITKKGELVIKYLDKPKNE